MCVVVFFFALALHSFWSYFSTVLSFCLFILFLGFFMQEYRRGLPFPSPVDHVLSEFFTTTWPSWVALYAWLNFIELDKVVVHVIRLASFLWLWFQSSCPLMPSFSTYHLSGVSLTLDIGDLFRAAPAKHSCCSLPWMWGISSLPWLLKLDVGYLFSAAAPVMHILTRKT